jgi:hypothetical protein
MDENRLRKLAGLNEASSERDAILMSAIAATLGFSPSKMKEGLTGKDLGRYLAKNVDSKVLKELPKIEKYLIQDPEGNGIWRVIFVKSETRIKGGRSTTDLAVDLKLEKK